MDEKTQQKMLNAAFEKTAENQPFVGDIKGEDYPKETNGEKNGRNVFILKPGFSWNPLLKFPRNSKCFCGSGLKFKKCHFLKGVCPTVPTNMVQTVQNKMEEFLEKN